MRRRTDTRDLDAYGEPLEGTVELIPTRQDCAYPVDVLTEDTMLTLLKDRGDALTAKAVMEHVGGLAFMASRLSVAAPTGNEYFNAVVAAYAEKAIRRMMERR